MRDKLRTTAGQPLPATLSALALLAGLCAGQQAHAGPGPGKKAAPGAGKLNISITSPRGGITDEDFTVNLEANVSDPRIQTALLAVNGAVYHVPVSGGRISQTVVVVPGNNRVGVVVRRGAEVARDSVTFYLRGKHADLIVLLTWPSRGEIIDLWVREPGGETCKWDHRETKSSGRLLDFSKDAIGFGSQAYLLPAVKPGRYRIKVHYWGAYAEDDDRGAWAYEELIDRLDKLDTALKTPGRDVGKLRAERRDVVTRLDRWSSPAAPQTPVKAEAILFAGTPHERRWRFNLIPQRTGQLLTLGQVRVTSSMIRAARQDRVGTTP